MSRPASFRRRVAASALASLGLGFGLHGAAGACPSGDSGLALPDGFCATVFADGIGHARHLAVAASGVVYVNTWSGDYYGSEPLPPGGFLVALKDTRGTGVADVIERFGETVASGGAGGTGLGIFAGMLYAESNDRIVRYALPSGAVAPRTAPETVISGLPLGGDHPMHPFAIDSDGSMYVDVASASNSCQVVSRALHSPGVSPCTELETRGGIWRYDATKTGQVFSAKERFATGIRNAEGFAIDSRHRVLVTQHGRDQLRSNWPELYQPEDEATLPAEELLLLRPDGDYGWPDCYFDPGRRRLVLAPEYGGDGGRKVGGCAQKLAPVAFFPAHWAPDGMVRYDRPQFPARYRDGVFIAFHGSWNRAPYTQGGYNIVFQALHADLTPGRCEIFADGFAGKAKTPERALYRPTGLAVGPDGALYVSDDGRGRIYRIVYEGPSGRGEPRTVPCPNPAAPAGQIAAAEELPPYTGPLSSGVTAERVTLGARIYLGEVGGASCTGCHGADGAGTVLGPNLSDGNWLWSDGSWEGIAATIKAGVLHPQQHRAAMPAMGGAQLTEEQLSALAAYVWSLSHRPATN